MGVRRHQAHLSEQAAIKCACMAVMRPEPTGQGSERRVQQWKAALNACEITFESQLSAARRRTPDNTGNAVYFVPPSLLRSSTSAGSRAWK